MATFLLVHGAWHGGWAWRKLVPLLRAAGHEVLTPTLTGLGERAHLAGPGVDLSTHVEDLLAVLHYEDLRRVTLVGHSYAGLVLSAAAPRAADRLARLVYLDAFVPEHGQSMLDLFSPTVRERVEAEIEARGPGAGMPPPPPEQLGVVDPPDAAWLAARLVPQPFGTYLEPLRLDGSCPVPCAYVYCAEGRYARLFAPHAARARAAGWPYRELAASHDAMVTAPVALAEALLDLTRSHG